MVEERFWLEYVDARGEPHGGPLEVMWPTRFRGVHIPPLVLRFEPRPSNA